ncbi:cilia- and flagella-associated protein 100 isoform X2 [Lepisosteus oculatus]|uniref:cilia- and flagella-associated protein 100 isoform X2 n=1 Tax=Lepisosteus oculatus TaxID=7918 RepID=UPI003712AC63
MMSSPSLAPSSPGSPETVASGKLSIPEDDNQVNKNPFKLPADNDIFLLRDKERERMKLVREQQKKLKIHEKTTYAGRMNTKRVETRRAMKEGEEMTTKDKNEREALLALKDDPTWKLAMTRDRNIERESINEFISKKREMFLLQYSLAVKRDEIRKLDEVAAAEESKLEKAEQFLEDDAAMFDEFLKENDKNSVEAIKIAEQEAKVKLEKVAEKKRLSAKIVSIKSDISKYEDILKEYMTYKEFLLKLSPKEWQQKYEEKHRKNKQARAELKNKEVRATHSDKRMDSRSSNVTQQGGREVTSVRDSRMSSRHSLKPSSSSRKLSSRSQIDEDNSSDDAVEEPELYFTEPQQLLDILTELEEQNLSLIQNSRETEEALEEFKHTMVNTQKKMDQETEILKQQIDILKQTIEREKERAAELELKARLFSFGQYKSEDQDDMMETLGRKVEEVYRTCIGDNEANLSTLQMLASIEGRLDELFENIEMIPREKVQLAERAKEKERRLKLREEKIKMQKQHQEERLRKALERAQVDIKKPAGKRLMFRSQPPARKVKENKDQDITDKEKEEQLYFFT